MFDVLLYGQKMEQFYNALADVMLQRNCSVWLGPGSEEPILHPELLLFETTLCGGVYDDQLESLLQDVAERGYRIAMNFHEPNVVLGNVAVKINDRWFAFGECINQSALERWEGQYVTEIWPLKAVIPKLREIEVKLRYAIPIRPTQERCARFSLSHAPTI